MVGNLCNARITKIVSFEDSLLAVIGFAGMIVIGCEVGFPPQCPTRL